MPLPVWQKESLFVIGYRVVGLTSGGMAGNRPVRLGLPAIGSPPAKLNLLLLQTGNKLYNQR